MKEYTNGEVTVVWKSDACVHSGICVKGLPSVFDVNSRPWINMEGASTEEIIQQVQACPSGALTCYMNDGSEIKSKKVEAQADDLPKIADKVPKMIQVEEGKSYYWCACGLSANQPWCDGSHKGSDFTPMLYKADETKKVAVCMCKKTGNQPFCDGNHANI